MLPFISLILIKFPAPELQLDEGKYNENKYKPLIEWRNLSPAVVNIAIKPEWKKAMDRKSFCNGYLR